MKKLLLTGFGPYATTTENPSESVAIGLDKCTVGGVEIVATIAPSAFFKSIEHVKNIMLAEMPDYVIMMGEYIGRSMLTFERYAHNLIDSSRYGLADNDNVSYDQKETVVGGPTAYQSTLPLKAMVAAARIAGVPTDISEAPGTFICNHLMYGILHEIAIHKLQIKACWAHLPLLPSAAASIDHLGQPSMSAETASQGIIAAIKALAEFPEDISKSTSRLQI